MKLSDLCISPVVCYCWRILFIWTTFVLLGTLCQDYMAKACLGGTEQSPPVNVTLLCPDNTVIILGDAIYGRNTYGACTLVDGDCMETTDIFASCKGLQNCTITLEKTYSPQCGYITFLKVNYDCRTVLVVSRAPEEESTRSTERTSSTVAGNTITVHRSGIRDLAPETVVTEQDNTGLIAGCAVAVVITVVLLIVAIVMVVRRLACAVDNVDNVDEKKATGCQALPCIEIECSETDSRLGPEDCDITEVAAGDSTQVTAKERKRRRCGSKGRDRNQNTSARLAPVGQEDFEQAAAAAVVASRNLIAASRCSGKPSALSSMQMDQSEGAASNPATAPRQNVAAPVTSGKNVLKENAAPSGTRFEEEHERRGKGERHSLTAASVVNQTDSIDQTHKAANARPLSPASAMDGAANKTQTTKGRDAPTNTAKLSASAGAHLTAVALPNTEASTSC